MVRQGRFGDNSLDKPSMFDVINSYKWDAWNNVRGMERSIAYTEYMNLLVGLDMLSIVPEGYCLEAKTCFEDGSPTPKVTTKPKEIPPL